MRRTRHVVLPVRSWHYIGLMVVSLACLTLGLVSRDREGKSGSLTSPELKHNAPHGVDACPNDYPLAYLPIISDGTAPRRVSSEILQRRTRDVQTVRAKSENEIPSRVYIRRSSTRRDMRARIDERRSISLDRRHHDFLRTREVRDERLNQRSRSLEQRVRELNDHVSSELRTRRTQRQSRLSTTDRRERLSRDNLRDNELHSRDRRLIIGRRTRNTERRDRSRTDVRRENSRVDERRSLDRLMERRERVQDIRRENSERRGSSNRLNERKSIEREGNRGIVASAVRLEDVRTNKGDSLRRNVRMSRVSREQRNSMIKERLLPLEDRVRNQKSHYGRIITEKEFPLVKTTFNSGDYEFLRQIFILGLCIVYTASIFKRKTGLIGNILPQMKQLKVW